MHAARRYINCIVPEHILKKLLESDDEQIRAAAYRTIVATASMRGARHAIGPAFAALTVSAGGLRRTIYDAGHKQRLPGKLVRGEGGQPLADRDVNNAYDGLGETFKFYKEAFGRNSIDNNGMRLDASVHYGVAFNNAFWNGRQMVFGDGDGVIFRDFTVCLDVIGHELTHGVTEHDCGLVYEAQSGALNESISDVFGSLVKQYSTTPQETTANADWLIGAGLLGPTIKGEALRSMKEPGTAYDDPRLGKDPQPGTMADFVETADDNGGVHINSGIPNRAFYLCAAGLGGFAWSEAGRIWYTSLSRFPKDASFQQAADITYATAGELYGSGSKQQAAVGDAWEGVGIDVAGRAPGRTRPAAVEATAEAWDETLDHLADQVLARVMAKMGASVPPAFASKPAARKRTPNGVTSHR
jgi:Zn-dependent metalloprotease